MARRHMEDPKSVERYCISYETIAHDSCIYGLTGWYISYFASLKEAAQMCTKLEAKNIPKCQKMISSYQNQF